MISAQGSGPICFSCARSDSPEDCRLPVTCTSSQVSHVGRGSLNMLLRHLVYLSSSDPIVWLAVGRLLKHLSLHQPGWLMVCCLWLLY